MNATEVYSEVLNALESLDKNEVSEYWKNYLQREHCTGTELRNSAVFRGDTATILYALKLDLEEQLRSEQARKNGRKNYSAVKRFMKMCRENAETKPFFGFAHEFDGRFFACNPYCFYVSDSRDGLLFATPQQEKFFELESKKFYENTVKKFDTYGQTYEIPYTVSQLKAWKKSQGKIKKPFSIGYSLPIYGNEQKYAAVDVDCLILAMEITGSNILQTDGKYKFAMENDSGDRFGMMCVYGTSPEFQVI